MNGSEAIVNYLAMSGSGGEGGPNDGAGSTSPSSSGAASAAAPPVSREQALLETFFHSLSHLSHDKSKDLVDREKDSVKSQLAVDASSSSRSRGRSGTSPSNPSSPSRQRGAYWLAFLHALSSLANVEREYWNLSFVGGAPPASGISFQSLFARKKESSLKVDCQSLLNELKKFETSNQVREGDEAVEEARSQQQQQTNLEGYPSQKLLRHLGAQLQEYVTARLKLIEFYEQMHALATSGSSSAATSLPGSLSRMDKLGESVSGDFIIILSDIVQSHHKSFHHPILSPLKTAFTTECDILLNLFQAQVEIPKLSILPSLLHLNDVHRKLEEWDSRLQSKRARGIGIGAAGAKKHSAISGDALPLYAWLWRFKGALLSKFTFYFHEVLSCQAPGVGDMKMLTAKTDVDFHARVAAFVRKTDAVVAELIFDVAANPDAVKGHFCRYRYPDKIQLVVGASSSPNCPPAEPFAVVFSYPVDPDRRAAVFDDDQHREILRSLVDASRRDAASTAASAAFLSEARARATTRFEKSLDATFVLARVDPDLFLFLVFAGRRTERDSQLTAFLEETTTLLHLSHVFKMLKPGVK